jgi:hypothetical protein
MLLTFASTFAFSSWIAASPGTGGRGFATPSMRPPALPARVLAPTVELVAAEPPLGVAIDPVEAPAPAAEPEEFAVPAVFVPGIVGTIAELPTPLGSLPELLSPPALAGPFGTPLTAAVPAPAAPALGVPTELAVPVVGPLAAPVAAPPAEVPPVDAPPADPPPPPAPLPPLCAKAASVPISVRTITNLLVFKALISTPVFKASVSQCGRLNLVPMAEGIAPLTKSSSGSRGAESAHYKRTRESGAFSLSESPCRESMSSD